MEQTIDLLRTRGYLTMNVRLGQEEVLIVSGPTGEAAVIDLTHGTDAHWRDAWVGVRQVLPRMPVVAVVPDDDDPRAEDYQVPVITVPDPSDALRVVEAVEEILHPPRST